MRLFSAIPIPDQIKDRLVAITRGKLPVPYLNVINLHITLNFFGELDTDQSNFVIAEFPKAVANHHRIDIEFDKIIRHHHGQLHLTVKPNEALKAFQCDLEEYFQQTGFRFPNREYYPHVTLARMHIDNMLYRNRKVELFPNHELQALNFTADKTVLYESKLLLHHAHHTPMAEVNLN
jgi:2'-5' RNA ligase